MKKILSRVLTVLFAMTLLFSLVACNDDKKTPGDSGKKSEEVDKTEDDKTEGDKTEGDKTEGDLKEGEWKHANDGVVTALGGAASTSDPFAHANVVDRGWILNAYEPLFCYNGITGEREPRVGKTVTISDDGLVYSVEIYDNVYFQNGKHCTAEDIKSSYEYAKTSTYNNQFSSVVDHVEVTDDYKVDIILSEPSAPFLSNSDQIFIVDIDEINEQGDAFGTIENKAGTGAYYIEKYDPAVEIIMTYHEKFHRPLADGKRPIPSITFKVMTDASARIIAFEAGDLDFVNVPPSNFETIEESGLFNTHVGQTTQSVYLAINVHNKDALANKELRKAIAYAIDYDSVLMAGQEGMGEVTGKFAYPEMTIAAPKRGSNTVYTYDQELAKQHLEASGLTNVDIGSIICIAGSTHEKMAQVIQANLEEIGVKAALDTREQVTAIADMREGIYQSGVMGYYMMMDYDYYTGIVDYDGNKASIIKINNVEEIDYERVYELFAQGRLETDEEARRVLYTELDEIISDSAVHIPLLHTALAYAWDNDLHIEVEKPYTYHYTQFWNAYWE